MCLTVFAYQVHKQYPLILATNRDEFYERPTRPAQFWENQPDMLAGKDLEAGSTWMGITKNHRFAALTNYRDMKSIKENAPSRGQLVTDYLDSDSDPVEFFRSIKSDASDYNGFNLLFGSVNNLYYFNNQHLELRKLEPGFYSLSNAFLDTKWPKTEKALSDFKPLVKEENLQENKFFDLLRNTETYPDHILPATGLPIEKERLVSSIFILSDDYGTRSSTLLLANPAGKTTFTEKTFKPRTVTVEHTERHTF